MGRIVTTIPYKPREQFKPYHNRKERFAAIVAHRRAGKTVSCVNEEIKAALTCPLPNPRTAYIAPYYKQAKAVAWTYAKEYGLVIPDSKSNESELRIDFPHNGGQFRLYGADNPDALRGIYLDSVTLDENADMNPKIFQEVIRPALVDRRGRATFIGTPKGRNEFYNVCQHAKKAEDWFYLELKASETGLVPKEELKALHDMMSDDQYDQEFECSFDAAIVGAIWGKELKDVFIGSVPYDSSKPVYTAWDIGYTDDTSIWFFQVISGEIHVIDFYSTSGENIDHYCDLLADKGYEYETHWLPHDAKAKTLASGGKSIQEQLAERLGWGTLQIVPSLSLEDGIQAARMTIPKCFFDDRCIEGIEALKQYRREWDDDKKCFRKKPLHNWTSHPADAFRYLCIAWQEEFNTNKTVTHQETDAWGNTKNDFDWMTV